MSIKKFIGAILRKKTYSEESLEKTELGRHLNLLDLVLLGVGTSLGLGAYILAGQVARELAGPATIISFVIAGVASAFAALCYAEFAGRVPRAGSAYVYSYVCVGEVVAFTIGWDMILEYVIGNASLARGIIGYIDTLSGDHIKITMNRTMPMTGKYLAPYADFSAVLIIMLLSILMASGVKETAIFNDVFSSLNLLTLITVIIAGSFKADSANWNIPKSKIPADADGGEGGFSPFGISGITAGAAQCFFGFVGFDSVASAGEEAKNPQRNIPWAICIAVGIVIVIYVSISTVLTMMLPYYLMDIEAPLPHAFQVVGWESVRWIVTVGAVAALITSMLGGMYPPPRIIYAMANDGLLFKFMSKVYPRTKTPIIAISVSAVISAILALLLELHSLIEMLSIGTLLAYTIVSICVLRLRYEDPEMEDDDSEVAVREASVRGNCLRFLDIIFNHNRKQKPTRKTMIVSRSVIWLFFLVQGALNLIMTHATLEVLKAWWMILILVVLVVVILLLLIVVGLQPHTTIKLTFKVPLVPVLPAISIMMNFHLMLQLQTVTWIRLLIWVVIGNVLYFAYGFRNSVEGMERKQRKLEEESAKETPLQKS